MKIGAYEVFSEIGRGGMGAVYRARSTDARKLAKVENVEIAGALAGIHETEGASRPPSPSTRTSSGSAARTSGTSSPSRGS